MSMHLTNTPNLADLTRVPWSGARIIAEWFEKSHLGFKRAKPTEDEICLACEKWSKHVMDGIILDFHP